MPIIAKYWPRHFSLLSIRGRLALMLALAFLPAGAIAFQTGMTSLSARNAAVQGERSVQVVHGLNQIRDEITQLRESVRTLAANADLFAADLRECRQVLSASASQLGEGAAVSVLDEDGVVQCSSRAEAQGARGRAQSLIIEAGITGDVALGFIATPRFADQPVIAAVAPVSEAAAPQRLFLGVGKPVAPMLQSGDPAGFIALVNRDGDVLEAVNLDTSGAYAAGLREHFLHSSPSTLQNVFQVADKWAIVMPVENGDLYLVQGWSPAPPDLSDFLRAAWALGLPVLLWSGAVIATWLAVERFVARPLLVLEVLARAYARGEDSDSDEALLLGAPLEITNLRRTLAAMAKTLRGREARLAVALQEERALLLEVNHRVKNNLQMVASILSIQARNAPDLAEARGLSRAQDRVQLLAIAHAQIYGSGEVREIAIDELARETVRALSSRDDAPKVQFDLALEPLRANADRAVPLAFLIGESISSLLDLNEEGARIESVSIKLAPAAGGGFVLELDAQSGAPQTPALSATSQRLVGAFTRQIGAELQQDPARPYYIRIEAPGQTR